MKALWANEAAEYHSTYYDFPSCAPSRGRCSNPIRPSFSVVWRSRCSNARRLRQWLDAHSQHSELIRQGRAILNELAVDAGRDPKSITVLA